HDIRPIVVLISESRLGVFQSTVQVPADIVDPDNVPRLVWPPNCVTVADDEAPATLWRCEGGLAGNSLALEYPRSNPALATFFRFIGADGGVVSAMLPPDQ